jgi:hypothetical protein
MVYLIGCRSAWEWMFGATASRGRLSIVRPLRVAVAGISVLSSVHRRAGGLILWPGSID